MQGLYDTMLHVSMVKAPYIGPGSPYIRILHGPGTIPVQGVLTQATACSKLFSLKERAPNDSRSPSWTSKHRLCSFQVRPLQHGAKLSEVWNCCPEGSKQTNYKVSLANQITAPNIESQHAPDLDTLDPWFGSQDAPLHLAVPPRHGARGRSRCRGSKQGSWSKPHAPHRNPWLVRFRVWKWSSATTKLPLLHAPCAAATGKLFLKYLAPLRMWIVAGAGSRSPIPPDFHVSAQLGTPRFGKAWSLICQNAHHQDPFRLAFKVEAIVSRLRIVAWPLAVLVASQRCTGP